jgi:amidase
MDRRDFLQSALLVGMAGAGRTPGAGPGEAAGPPGAGQAAFELEEATVAALAEGQAAGRWTARGLTEQYLSRIGSIDRSGPRLNAVIELNPDAVEIAEGLDRERRERGARGPLHGIPVLVKDNLDSGDRMRTSAGSLALENSRAPRDSTVVARLRIAGAVLLGKTNLSEWANYRSTSSTSGWSARGGLTRNPYVLDRNPCGSSSGSGAAAAANLAAVTIGTETDGSITCPSSICGLVGIKPTVGLVSRAGIIPISATQDTAGPMCRTVADAAAVLEAIQGVDLRDRATARATGRLAGYAGSLRRGLLKGARLGVARRGFGLPDSVEPVLGEALAALRTLGAVLVDPAEVPHAGALGDPEIVVLDFELKQGLADYFAERGGEVPVKSLADIIAYNRSHRDREMPWFGQEIFERSQRRGALSDPVYRKALADCRRLSRTLGIDAVMTRHRLDALIAITAGPAWPTDLVNGDRYTGGSSSPAAVAGYPHLTVPAGWLHGLPIGLSFFGRPWSEARLIGLAYDFEQETRVRRSPGFKPSV